VEQSHFREANTWLSHYATSRNGAGSFPDEVIGFFFFNYRNPSTRTVALGSTQPLTEMNTRKIPGDNGWPARKAGDFTAICEPIA
jgi:hypothetical protein